MKAALIAHDVTRDEHRILASVGAAVVESIPVYETTFGQFDEWAKRVDPSLLGRSVLRGEELYPDPLLYRSTYYNEFLEPFDTCQMACIGSAGTLGTYEALSVYRGPNENSFSSELIATLQMLIPHLYTALSVRRKLDQLQGSLNDIESTLDSLSLGVVLVRREGTCHSLNRAAQAILDRGILSALEPGDASRLRHLVGSLTRRTTTVMSPQNAVLISRRKGRPLQLLGSPFRQEALPGQPRAAAMIIITDPENKTRVPVETLALLFGLTPAEGRLAIALANGDSLTDAADLHRVRHETARKQLKSIFQKTHTNRQGELIRLINGLIGPLPPQA
ncbi:MAG: helix-turn-helix transcriptional regulator [Acidobacteriaceae bacterium]|nr:helix-turn-helix transcriptional regulator [Acidobacteriaceae bacterium]